MIGHKIEAETVDQVSYEILEKLIKEGKCVAIEEDKKGKRSSGNTIELQNLFIVIKQPSTNIKMPKELSVVTKKFLDGMLYKTKDKLQSKRVIEQKQSVIDLLRTKSHTRKASIAVWECTDISAPYIVCLTYLQFFIREGFLHQTAVFRSHDMWNGFLYNTKGNLMLQTEIASALNLDIGTYTELAVSAHVYEIDLEEVRNYVEELTLDWDKKD